MSPPRVPFRAVGRPLAVTVVGIFLVAASPALAGPHAESDSVVGTTEIHQEINYSRSAVHFWFHAYDPGGVDPFCVKLKLERRSDGGGWQGIGMSSRRGRTECCPQPDEECFPSATDGYWDLFLYPNERLRRKIRRGVLRIRAFSDFGPSLVLRF